MIDASDFVPGGPRPGTNVSVGACHSPHVQRQPTYPLLTGSCQVNKAMVVCSFGWFESEAPPNSNCSNCLKQARYPNRALQRSSSCLQSFRWRNDTTEKTGSAAPLIAAPQEYLKRSLHSSEPIEECGVALDALFLQFFGVLRARFWFISRVLLVSQFPPAPDFLEFLNQRELPPRMRGLARLDQCG